MKQNKRSREIFDKLCELIDQGDQKSVEILLRSHQRKFDKSQTPEIFDRALHSKNPNLAYHLFKHVRLQRFKHTHNWGSSEHFLYNSLAHGREDVAAVLCIAANKRIGTFLNVASATLASNNVESLKRWCNSNNESIVLNSTPLNGAELPVGEFEYAKVRDLSYKAVNHTNGEFCAVLAAYEEFVPHMLQCCVSQNMFSRYCDIINIAQDNHTLTASLLSTLSEPNQRLNDFERHSDAHLAYFRALFERVKKQKWTTYLNTQIEKLKQPHCNSALFDMLYVAYKFGGPHVFSKWDQVVPKIHPNHQHWASELSRFLLQNEIDALEPSKPDVVQRKSRM